MGFKLAEGKGLREGWVPVESTGMEKSASRTSIRDAKGADSKELWKSVEK